MHKYLFESSKKRDLSQRRQDACSRREVVFQIPKRRKKTPSRLSLVSILTSPRQNTPEDPNDASKSYPVGSSSEFYSKPKSLLELQYEQKVQSLVSLNETFVPLDSASAPESESNQVVNEKSDQENMDMICVLANSPEIGLSFKITPNSAARLLSQDDVQMGLLLLLSDRFIEEAYKCVLETNDIVGTELYCSLIKLALTCLHKLLHNYSEKLNPQLELATYYKLAKIYFFETENLDSAEKYVSLALALATRHNLRELLIASDLLHCSILKSYKPNILRRFLESKISFYSSGNMVGIRDLFVLLKAQSYLSTEAGSALSQLRILNLRSDVGPTIRILSLLLEASVQIYHGNALHAKGLLKQASNKNSSFPYPSQLRGLHLLLSLYFYIQVGDYQKGKDASKELSKFITRQKRKEWSGWSEDGNISLQVNIDEANNFDCHIRWRNPEEFVIEFYLLSGVLLLTNESSYEKASETFQKCLQSIQGLLESYTSTKKQKSGFSTKHLTEIIIRLNYIRYFIVYYQTWLDIISKGDHLRIQFVQEFLNSLNDGSFSDQELSIYRLLEDLYMYLNALYHLMHGDLLAAKFLLLRVRESTSTRKQVSEGNFSSFRQMELGIGCEELLGKGNDCQLFLYSTIHLSLICEFELSVCGQNLSVPTKENSSASACRSLLSMLSTDLEPALLTEASFGVGYSDKLLFQTLKLISSLLSFKYLSRISTESSIRSERAINKNSPIILKALEMFFNYQESSDGSDKKRLVESLRGITSKQPLVKYIQNLTVDCYQVNLGVPDDLRSSSYSSRNSFIDEFGDKIDLAHQSFRG